MRCFVTTVSPLPAVSPFRPPGGVPVLVIRADSCPRGQLAKQAGDGRPELSCQSADWTLVGDRVPSHGEDVVPVDGVLRSTGLVVERLGEHEPVLRSDGFEAIGARQRAEDPDMNPSLLPHLAHCRFFNGLPFLVPPPRMNQK